jgi:hypothetical protein
MEYDDRRPALLAGKKLRAVAKAVETDSLPVTTIPKERLVNPRPVNYLMRSKRCYDVA